MTIDEKRYAKILQKLKRQKDPVKLSNAISKAFDGDDRLEASEYIWRMTSSGDLETWTSPALWSHIYGVEDETEAADVLAVLSKIPQVQGGSRLLGWEDGAFTSLVKKAIEHDAQAVVERWRDLPAFTGAGVAGLLAQRGLIAAGDVPQALLDASARHFVELGREHPNWAPLRGEVWSDAQWSRACAAVASAPESRVSPSVLKSLAQSCTEEELVNVAWNVTSMHHADEIAMVLEPMLARGEAIIPWLERRAARLLEPDGDEGNWTRYRSIGMVLVIALGRAGRPIDARYEAFFNEVLGPAFKRGQAELAFRALSALGVERSEPILLGAMRASKYSALGAIAAAPTTRVVAAAIAWVASWPEGHSHYNEVAVEGFARLGADAIPSLEQAKSMNAAQGVVFAEALEEIRARGR